MHSDFENFITKDTAVRRPKNRLWRSGLLIAALLGVALLALACGEDQQSQSAAQQEDVLETGAVEAASDADQQQEPAAPQAQSDEDQSAQQQQQAASTETQQTQSQSDTATQPEQQRAPPQQQAAQQSSSQEQPAQQVVEEESVPEGTRLITLFGDLTEIVYALGAQDFLVARDASSIYPPEAEELPNLGFAGGLNAEAILEFAPSLVIGTPMAGPLGVLEQLEQAGVEVLIVDDFNSLDAPQIKIRMIGEALGIPERAEELALDVEARMEAVIAAAVTDKPLRVLLVYIRRGGLQLVSGEGNKSQAIIKAAGAIDAATEAGIVGWQLLTPEALVASNPDVYLVMDRGLEVVGGIEGLLEIPGMAQTKAGRDRHIISMPDLYLLGFGPRLPEAIADLSEFLREVQDESLSE